MMDEQSVEAVFQQVLEDAELGAGLRRLAAGRKRRGINLCLMGIDGSGKTTLSEQLARVFVHADVPAQRRHIYSIYSNLLLTPFILLLNRYIWRRVLIFDRTIYDNIAVFFYHKPSLQGLQPLVVRMVRLMYPRFDAYFYLQATLEQTLERRLEVSPQHYLALGKSYHPVIEGCGFRVFRSQPQLLRMVADCLVEEGGRQL